MEFILAKTYSHWPLRFLLWSHAIPPVFCLQLLSNFPCKCPSYNERSTVNIIPLQVRYFYVDFSILLALKGLKFLQASCLADMLSGLILVFVSPVLFVPIIYFLVGFAPGLLSIINTYLACTLAIAACTGCAYFISAISPDENLANLIAPAFLIPFFLYSGFFIPFPGKLHATASWQAMASQFTLTVKWSDVPKWFYPIQFTSWFYYGVENLIINQWEGTEICLNFNYTERIANLLPDCDLEVGSANDTTIDQIQDIIEQNQDEACLIGPSFLKPCWS